MGSSDDHEQEKIPFQMYKTAGLIALQSFLYGYCSSALNGCITTGDDNSGSDCYHGTDHTCPKGTVYNDINLTDVEVQLATALLVIGGWIGCMVGSYPSEKYGRRWTLLWNNAFFIIGAVLTGLGNLPCLLVGRFISGLGLGVTTVVPPVLLSEISSPATRGIITTAHQLLLTFGIFFVSILSFGFVTYVNHGWQYIQAFGAIPALIMILFKDSIPESPKWLLSRDSTEASRQKVVTLFNKIRPSDYNVESEIQVILDETKNDANNDATWGEVFACRKAVIIGVGLMFFQAATGINSVVFYSSSIFQLAGFSESIIGTAIWTIVNFFMTFVSAKLIDQTGRKILILSGTYGMLFSLLLLSLVLLSPIDGTIQGIIAVLAILLFVAGFAIGLGAVCWTILSEIMPTRLRSKAISLFLSVNWGANLLIAMLTLTAINGLGGVKSDMDDDEQKDAQKVGVGALYLVFAGVTAASLAFIHLYVPETKGKTPEDLLSVSTPLLRETDGQRRTDF